MNNKIYYVITALGLMSFDLGGGCSVLAGWEPQTSSWSCLPSKGSQVPATMPCFFQGSRESCCVANTLLAVVALCPQLPVLIINEGPIQVVRPHVGVANAVHLLALPLCWKLGWNCAF